MENTIPMFLNPQSLVDKKIITFPTNIDITKHLQQNGIDVDCDKVSYLPNEIPIVGKSLQVKPKLVDLKKEDIYKGEIGWYLKTGRAYSFDSTFYVEIPEGMCGWLIGRSSFNRSGVLIRSGLFDSGFKGYLGATIYCFSDIKIEQGARIAQFVMAKAENASLYNGQYQDKK